VGWSLIFRDENDLARLAEKCRANVVCMELSGSSPVTSWADELSAQLNKIRPKACICGILQAGERWISVTFPPPNWRKFLNASRTYPRSVGQTPRPNPDLGLGPREGARRSNDGGQRKVGLALKTLGKSVPGAGKHIVKLIRDSKRQAREPARHSGHGTAGDLSRSSAAPSRELDQN
jgi:hypothetical protein